MRARDIIPALDAAFTIDEGSKTNSIRLCRAAYMHLSHLHGRLCGKPASKGTDFYPKASMQ
jgi:hypothetical protein